MNIKSIKSDVAVIVARFQCGHLTDAHTELINFVCERHPKVILFLGIAPVIATRNNPLDFEARKQMVLSIYSEITVLPIRDVNNDSIWSSRLDEEISNIISPIQSVVIYGGRDSFIPHYCGRFKTQELVSDSTVSATQYRTQVSKKMQASREFREGIIWACYNQYPKTFTTVDIAVINKLNNTTLLARKPTESLFRFVGGFSMPNSDSFELDATRELQEETGLIIVELDYIGSKLIDDFRYRGEVDKIKTVFYVGYYNGGIDKADDDIAETRWFDLNTLTEESVIDIHRPLLIMLRNHLKS